MMNTGYDIEINGLGVRHNNSWVLRGFDLKVLPGEKVALSGPSGSGKSTVLKCVMGLVEPQEGSISVQGRALNAHSIWSLRHQLAYVAQEPDLGTGTPRQALESAFAYKANVGLRDNLKKLPVLAERFKLSESLLDKESVSLSGGEKQRFALVAALLLERPIILLDEVSSALDKVNKQVVVDFIQEAVDTTVVSVAHDPDWLSFAERVVHLDIKANIPEVSDE
ncbi:MAG: ABC transporter ATP-binding protein [Kiritimatiellae bacterium]|nr:ABC transporter ATP-binding protein [Kiritimatiellia bacterium]